MPQPVIFKKNELPEDRALRPGMRKLCPPLADWRTDAPESYPFCVACGAVIRIGMPYVVGYPNVVLCRPCGDPRGVLR